jgi:hypothetical protein
MCSQLSALLLKASASLNATSEKIAAQPLSTLASAARINPNLFGKLFNGYMAFDKHAVF